MDLGEESLTELEEDILGMMFTGELILHQCRHEEGEVLVIEWYRDTRD